jgi:uncharacterized protein YggE
MKTIVALFIFYCAAGCTGNPRAVVGENAQPRTITVTGDADVLVSPDQAIIRFSVQMKRAGLDRARGDVNRRVKSVLETLKKLGVAPRHIRTDHMHIWPNTYYETRRIESYTVRKTISVTLEDLDKLEEIMSAAFQAGVNGLDGVEFRSTKLRQHKDQARLLAIQAAREKARAMSGALEQQIGSPRNINEHAGNMNGDGSNSGWGGWWWGQPRLDLVAQNMVQNATNSQGNTGNITAPGQLRINAKVTVAFDLR